MLKRFHRFIKRKSKKGKKKKKEKKKHNSETTSPTGKKKTENHWSCIAHLSAEAILKSAVTEENKFKHSPWAGADNTLRPKFYVNRKASSLWSFVASLKRISSTSDFIHIFSLFNKCI